MSQQWEQTKSQYPLQCVTFRVSGHCGKLNCSFCSFVHDLSLTRTQIFHECKSNSLLGLHRMDRNFGLAMSDLVSFSSSGSRATWILIYSWMSSTTFISFINIDSTSLVPFCRTNNQYLFFALSVMTQRLSWAVVSVNFLFLVCWSVVICFNVRKRSCMLSHDLSTTSSEPYSNYCYHKKWNLQA